ncbi:hypothetical protein H4582DRAFT_1521896 [Lactarius indigo]|nr:hypothetical protein H4582DRAFT_1521896 [Lactarius indigo]
MRASRYRQAWTSQSLQAECFPAHIFDGPPPVQPATFPPLPIPNTNPDDDVPPPALLLPISLPPRAFAGPPEHLARCADRANGDRCERGSTMLRVSTRSADVTLEVLPGREREFCSFVGKFIWGAGESVITSVHGVVEVSVRVEGLPVIGKEG